MTCKNCHLSASSVSCFTGCPMNYFYRYIKGIRTAQESDAQRMGTNWHTIMEVLGLTPGDMCPACAENIAVGADLPDVECSICDKTRIVPEDLMSAATRYIDAVYSVVPDNKTDEEWAVEKIRLLYSAMAYQKYYASQPMNVLGCEIPFEFPLRKNGRKVRGFSLVGKIDKLLHLPEERKILILDHKSSASNINDALFWSRFNMDIQTKFYPYALLEMHRQGLYDLAGHDIEVLIDAYHKPKTEPKDLTQAASKEFVDTGMYCGQKFELKTEERLAGTYNFTINGEPGVITPGKKEGTFAIRETPEMYGARLLQDISEAPETFFVRRQIPRTMETIDRFGDELVGIASSIRLFEQKNLWYRDPSHCEAKFKCDYIPICYEGIDVDRDEPIPGFIRREHENG